MITTKLDIRTHVGTIVPQVFETMLSQTITPGPDSVTWSGDRVSGAIGIEGDGIRGQIYIHFSVPLAGRVGRAMLGMSETDPLDDSSINDVVGEIANMVVGGLKSALCDEGHDCAMSTPSIMRGPNVTVEMPVETQSENFTFVCQGEILTVEVHLELH